MPNNIEALSQALRVLDAVPEHRLHMNVLSEKAECGTACCLAGWICMDPWFRENTEVGEVEIRDWIVQEGEYMDDLECYHAFCMVERSLDLEREDARELLAYRSDPGMDSHAITKAEVRANLERLIRGEPAEPYAALEGR